MVHQFPKPETASQNVVQMDQDVINETLIGWYTSDLKRIEEEIKQP